MDYDTFKFFDKACRFEETTVRLQAWIEEVADEWQQGAIKKKSARLTLAQILSGVDAQLISYQDVAKAAPPGYETLLERIKNQRDRLAVDAESLTESILGKKSRKKANSLS